MLEKLLSKYFCITSLLILVALIALYAFYSNTSFDLLMMDRSFWLITCSVISGLYIYLFRRKTLFCFEFIFFIFFIVCTFYSDLFLQFLDEDSTISSIYFITFPKVVENKNLLIQMLGFFAFITTSSGYNYYSDCYGNQRNNMPLKNKFLLSFDFPFVINCLSIIMLLLIVYLFEGGIIQKWFHYSQEISDYSNLEIVFCTVIFLVITLLEFTWLNKIGCKTIFEFLKNCHKLYLIEVVIIVTLLLISGNRNEALLIFVPIIVAYSLFIKPISNITFLTILFVGSFVMIVIGVIRISSAGLNSFYFSDLQVFEMSRDFALVDTDSKFLIQYVDQHEPIYFQNAFLALMSSIPGLGGIISDLFLLKWAPRSGQLTTDWMQLEESSSGMGTSLIGDLYYTSGVLWVLIFMLAFGWLIAYTHRRFVIVKDYNPWLLIIYLFNIANSTYYIRADWFMPLRYIGFSFTILFVMTIIVKLSKSN